MEWRPAPVPDALRECPCGAEAVEKKADGISRQYRCATCHTSLGDLPMGPEP